MEHNLTGGSRSFLNFIEILKEQDVEPFVVVSESWALTEELEKMNIPVLVSKMYRPFIGTINRVKFYRLKYQIKRMINSKAKRGAIKWFRDNGVQIVHINSQFAGIVGCQVAQELKIPYVYHIREYLDSDFGIQFYNQKLVDDYIKTANRIIAISQSIQSFYERKFNRKLELVYNGLPVYENTYEGYKARLLDDMVRLVIVGRVTDAKGQMDAVEALKILVKEYGYKNLVLHIVGYMGKDSYELKVKKFIDDNGIENHVVLHSFTNSPFEISKECDIGLTCSAAEAFGRITVEYMLASLFTIGANTGGTPEIILDRESGLLYKQGDSRELANKIKWTLEHKDDANRMIWMGQNRALDNFAITATAREIRRVYGELVGN
ncbi:glycosyltransferase family 4 protein [Enterocloster aldenensis]|uniref:glycosyltransferase family 4 protein n=1 Tax=Enterocloster aldenensis TaxID=358742 RepID=UPI001D05D7AB|nr:glycosyltransferase family 4 protein [Enterocloster aldenensis]